MLRPLAGALGFFAALLLASTNAIAADANSVRGGLDYLQAQAAVEDLAVCYARGTDALGRAVSAVISSADPEDPVNVGNPEFDAGLAYYRQCFSKDFSFTLEFVPGVPLLTIPAPGSSPTDPALQWANFVNNTFRGSAYDNTQHHMGSISSEVHADTANMVSYLIATHHYAAGGVNVVGGTYTDDVVLENGKWVLLHRTLLITSSAANLP